MYSKIKNTDQLNMNSSSSQLFVCLSFSEFVQLSSQFLFYLFVCLLVQSLCSSQTTCSRLSCCVAKHFIPNYATLGFAYQLILTTWLLYPCILYLIHSDPLSTCNSFIAWYKIWKKKKQPQGEQTTNISHKWEYHWR